MILRTGGMGLIIDKPGSEQRWQWQRRRTASALEE
jgi:hypothetical protein